MASSTSWCSGAANRVWTGLREWYLHWAGLAPLWSRLALPGALGAVLAGGLGTVAGLPYPALLPLLLGPLAAWVYAGCYVGMRSLTRLPLSRLKHVDSLFMILALGAAQGLLGALSPPSLKGWLTLPAGSLLIAAWYLNWGRARSECGTGTPPPPRPPRFVAPVGGPVTAAFRSYDRTHTGIDIGVSRFTPVVAAASGRVLHAGPLDQWGCCILLDHGRGWSTLLAHLDRTFLRPGEEVEAGEPVGLSGSSGISTGPHLHVELRYQGAPVDPHPYLVQK